MSGKTVKILVLVSTISVFGSVVLADEILDTINEATEAYKEKAFTEAVESLDYAKQLILQMTSEELMTFLPEPMAGWQGKEAKSQNMGMMGGSSSIEKEYSKPGNSDNGRKRIILTIMGDSPILQGMMSMFNPTIAGSGGGKLQKINRNKAVVQFSKDKRNGEIIINVAKKYLITVKGTNVEKEDLMYYAEAIDYKGLKAFQ